MQIRLDDMRMFAALVDAKSFTAAADTLGIPKQTLSRRIAELEQSLDTELVTRTTRRFHLTPAGARYAVRCADVVRIADDANRALLDERDVPRGTLRVTADPLLGEVFLPPVLAAFARQWPDVTLEVLLTQRRVDLIEERFDIAFRVGHVDDPALTAVELGPARVRFCASATYLRRRGRPKSPADLSDHDCIVVRSDLAPAPWPFRDEHGGARAVVVEGRVRCNSHVLAHAAALDGLGIAIFPEFACAEDIRRKRLVAVLDNWRVDVGKIWLVHPSQRFGNVAIQRFMSLALEHLEATPWK